MSSQTVSRTFRALVAGCLLSMISGCTMTHFVELREKPQNPLLERLHDPAADRLGPSKRTQQFFHATAWSGSRNLSQMLRHSRNQIGGPDSGEARYAAAEISYLSAQQARKTDPALAMELYLDAARFSWDYFSTHSVDPHFVSMDEPKHREVMETYNASVAALLRALRDSGEFQLGQSVRLPISGRHIRFDLPYSSPWINRDQLGGFEFVADYELKNLRHRHAKPGLGVPVIVQRKRTSAIDPMERYYAEGLRIPATIVLRFPGRSDAPSDILMQIFDPRDTDGIVIEDTLHSLEADLSTPLARFLTNPDMKLLDTWGFLRPDRARKLQGLYMVQPYDPDRIPVLMVHGVWSSPVTWMEMFNDLQSDPKLRDRFQFWFYLYPTGEPVTFAAAALRDELQQLRDRCDPRRDNQKMDQMVVVGHSMGGLLSYLLTIDSEDHLWNAVSRIPVDDIQADTETKNQIRNVFFFESNPSIDRIVTIASPFAGSGYANRFTRLLGGSLIFLPNTTSQLSRLIFDQNNSGFRDRMFAPRTSVDSLTRDSAILRLVRGTRVPETVVHHNIIGISGGKSPSSWSDGIVGYHSAHRDDAVSEINVCASHSSIHRHPDTIAEVRRVLHEHLKTVSRRKFKATPVGRSAAQAPATLRIQAP